MRRRLVFGEDGQTGTGGDSVEVTRIDNRTWHVKSQGAPNDRAYCVDDGQLYEMQVTAFAPFPVALVATRGRS